MKGISMYHKKQNKTSMNIGQNRPTFEIQFPHQHIPYRLGWPLPKGDISYKTNTKIDAIC